LKGKACLSNFTQSTLLLLRKYEGLSEVTAAAVNRKDIDDFYQVYAELVAEFRFGEKPRKNI
jgi:hypothetical protein